ALIHKAVGLIKLLQLAFHNFGDRLRRFVLDLLGGDFLFLRQQIGRHGFPRHPVRMARRDLKRNVFDQLLEILVGYRGFLPCTHLDQHANLRAGVNVCRHQAMALDLHARMAWDSIFPRILATAASRWTSRLAVGSRASFRATSSAKARNMSLRATKSVSQFTSTKTPRRPPGTRYWVIIPSRASRVAFVAAVAAPFL